jgi:hypothetical protein
VGHKEIPFKNDGMTKTVWDMLFSVSPSLFQ